MKYFSNIYELNNIEIIDSIRTVKPIGIESVSILNLSNIHTLVFAGGGNRCWWQAGIMAHWIDSGCKVPTQLIGTSAGAAIAASTITTGPSTALDACLYLYSANERIFEWRDFLRLQFKFAHAHIYPAWVRTFINQDTLRAIQQSNSSLSVAITRPAKILGVSGSVLAGTLAYITDKYLWNSIHPRLPSIFGLRQDFMDLKDCSTIEEMQMLLCAAAAAPPFMRTNRIGEQYAMDGGYTDNAPIPSQSDDEKSGTLVLLTRHYAHLPPLFRWRGRAYWQPTKRVPVSTWDCTFKATVRDAFALGKLDIELATKNNLIHFA